jgi:hypothetical protein
VSHESNLRMISAASRDELTRTEGQSSRGGALRIAVQGRIERGFDADLSFHANRDIAGAGGRG